ncbi:MAG TPA: site-specific integrase [Bryobacteraceae bacterium]|jgi:integrase|nr:site-specific integrase [Bryobacteraceae bacterium]
MGVYRRKEAGVWYVDFFANGKRVQESTGSRNKREAEKYLALRVSEVQRGVYVKLVHVPLPELWERYFAYARTHKRSWERDVQMFRNLENFLGTATLTSITPLRVEEYQQHRNREVAPATVNRETALLKHMFNMAERWGLYQGTNPVRLVKFLPENNLQFQTVSEGDEQRLLESSPPYLRELILFATNTGLRCGDLLDLKWEEVDIEEKRLSLIMGKTARRLEIPLNETALAILAAKHAAMHGPHVFYNPVTGDRFYDLKAGFKAILKRAGLTGITWHTLRHTFASRLTRSGVDLVTVKELLGHSTINTTMRYAHSNHDTKARAVAKLPTCDKTVAVVPRKARKPKTTV